METRRQQGSAHIEFALTVGIFIIVILAIMEFALIVLDIARANEATRAMARISIVDDPVCDFTDGGCPSPTTDLVCPGGDPVTVSLEDYATGCSTTDSTACRMWDAARAHVPDLEPAQIEVTYACSGAGAAIRPRPIPLVTVGLRNVTTGFIFPELLQVNADVAVPEFNTTRTGEDMYTQVVP